MKILIFIWLIYDKNNFSYEMIFYYGNLRIKNKEKFTSIYFYFTAL